MNCRQWAAGWPLPPFVRGALQLWNNMSKKLRLFDILW